MEGCDRWEMWVVVCGGCGGGGSDSGRVRYVGSMLQQKRSCCFGSASPGKAESPPKLPKKHFLLPNMGYLCVGGYGVTGRIWVGVGDCGFCGALLHTILVFGPIFLSLLQEVFFELKFAARIPKETPPQKIRPLGIFSN